MERYVRECERMDDVQRLRMDPFAYSFEARGNTPDHDQGRVHGHLVYEILVGSKHLQRVVSRLRSNKGCFEEREACDIVEDLIEYVQEGLFPDLMEEDTSVATDHIWALGVILYYLLCGYPKLNNQHRLACYKNVRIGPEPHTESWKLMERGGHKFPSREWCEISDSAKRFIKDLCHFNPGNRPSIVDIWYVDGSAWYNSLRIPLEDIYYREYDSEDSDEITVALSLKDGDSGDKRGGNST